MREACTKVLDVTRQVVQEMAATGCCKSKCSLYWKKFHSSKRRAEHARR